MSVEVKIPEVGESVSEALISQWFKSEGDSVDADEPLAELETDKVTVELPSPAAGTLSKIVMGNGETASVGDVIAYIEENGAGTGKKAEAKEQGEKKAKEEDEGEKAEKKSQKTEDEAEGAPSGDEGEPRVMPAAQRLLEEHGLNASDVEGSGPGGRILKEDVEKAVEKQKDEGGKKKEGEEKEARGKGPELPTPPSGKPGAREEEVVPMTPIRKRIAQRLVSAQENAALLTTFNEVDMSAVMELRSEHKEAFEKRYGIKLGFMSFFVKASVDALRQFPQVNAEIRDESIVYKNYFDIGIAVSTDRGLMVPILRDAQSLSFAEIELGIADFASRAREGRIKLEELEGGTFTITNGGIFGSMLSTPIINPPQSGVLGLHAIQERPVAVDGQVEIRPVMYVALTYDHRLVDGREAVTFLRRIKEAIEEPSRMLLEV
jgi:2-oxoglutarate dehydrogenase E2 component (dihydrolipoamide succinyltransferase)